MKHQRSLPTITLLLLALFIFLAVSQATVKPIPFALAEAYSSPTNAQAVNAETIANCRYGTTPAVDDGGEKTAVVSQIGAGWYVTFGYLAPYPPPENDADFVHMVKVRQKKAGAVYLPGYETDPRLDSNLASYIQANPGDTWIFGNEIERGPNPDKPEERGQGDIHAEEYAVAYFDFYQFVKAADPTAQVAFSGLVEVTPGRLQYLDKVWNTYLQEFGQPMPVDIWTMHVYVLPEVEPDGITPNGIANVALGTDPALGKRGSDNDRENCADPDVYCIAEHDDIDVFAEQVVAMRQWMADHGQKEKPLLLSEFSILYPFEDYDDPVNPTECYLMDEYSQCFTPNRVKNFMNEAFNYLENEAIDPNLGYALDNNRLVQQHAWFTVFSSGLGAVSNLVEADWATLTPLGENFKSHVASEQPSQNLLIEQVKDVVAAISNNGTATVPLSVTFRNNGNTRIDEPFTVTFYEDENLNKPIGEATVNGNVLGCTSRPYVASVTWSGLSIGTHNFWVKIDSRDVINEQPGDADNIGTGQVLITEKSLFLPVVRGYR